MERRSGDPRFPIIGNKVAELIELAVERLGYEVDEAVCIIANVAADYWRSEYGNDTLVNLAAVVQARGDMPLPDATAPEGEG